MWERSGVGLKIKSAPLSFGRKSSVSIKEEKVEILYDVEWSEETIARRSGSINQCNVI